MIFSKTPSISPLMKIRSFFFFQAEDGIRDKLVTGVQTCALPISPSPSSSPGQPSASTVAPRGVSEQRSRPSGIPSPSLSLGHPRASTSTPGGVSGHLSRPSGMLSPSESCEQPRTSTAAPATVLGQRSTPSGTPSLSLSLGQP